MTTVGLKDRQIDPATHDALKKLARKISCDLAEEHVMKQKLTPDQVDLQFFMLRQVAVDLLASQFATTVFNNKAINTQEAYNNFAEAFMQFIGAEILQNAAQLLGNSTGVWLELAQKDEQL